MNYSSASEQHRAQHSTAHSAEDVFAVATSAIAAAAIAAAAIAAAPAASRGRRYPR